MNNSKVKVVADAAGNVIRKSSNPEWGYIIVKQQLFTVGKDGFAKNETRQALIPGTIDNLSGFGWSADQEIEGKVIVREQLKPFGKKDPEKDMKQAGDSGVICKIGDSPIYRKLFYTPDVNAADTFLEHDNGDEITAAYAVESEEEAEGVVEDPNFDI